MYLFNLLKKQSQFLFEDNVYYINIKGYIFSYVTLKKKEALCIVLNKSIISKNDIILLSQCLKGNFFILLDQLALKKDTLYLVFKNNVSNDILSILNDFCTQLYELNYHTRTNCFICGSKTSLHNYKNILVPVEQNCLQKCLKEEKDIALNDKIVIKKSIILSFCFSLLGILPAIIIAYFTGGYSIISSILLFIPSFLAVFFFYKTKISRTKTNDLLCLFLSSFSFLIYHLIMIIMCVSFFNIKNVNDFLNQLQNYFIESILETIFVFILGYFSATFLVKKRRFNRLNHLK